MRLLKIQELWDADSKIDLSEIGKENARIDQLHSKYNNILSMEKLKLLEYKAKAKKLELEKYIFYTEGPSKEQFEAGWRLPAKGMIIKAEVNRYLEADEDMAKASFRVGYQVEKIRFIESILECVMNRSFKIKSAQRDIEFKAGVL